MGNPEKILIVGLGLIGGSVAKSLKHHPGYCFDAVFRNSALAGHILADGAIRAVYPDLASAPLESYDQIILGTPVPTAIAYLKDMLPRLSAHTVVTDVGSTKGEICAAASALGMRQFIGGHPMAGSEKTGYDAATATLFQNAYWVLTPTPDTPEIYIARLQSLASATGALTVRLSPEAHDHMTAVISHVPHIAASALCTMASGQEHGDDLLKHLAAGGFRDITRIASSSPELWESIISSNSDAILLVLEDYIRRLTEVRSAISSHHKEALTGFFASGRDYRDQLPVSRRSVVKPSYELIVDVEDRPGVIGELATLLGRHQVNLSNIGVLHSRESYPGALALVLPDENSHLAAVALLETEGYRVIRT